MEVHECDLNTARPKLLVRFLDGPGRREAAGFCHEPTADPCAEGVPGDHPAIDLLKNKQWGVSAKLPGDRAMKATLVKDVVERFKAAAPMIEMLNAPLVGKPKRPLF